MTDRLNDDILKILLRDRTTEKNILWMTDNYQKYGKSFYASQPITLKQITGKNKGLIKPRIYKSKEEQQSRIRDKAEVFTPAWVCNLQCNLVDDSYFEKSGSFNTISDMDKVWTTNHEKVVFPQGKNWQEYVTFNRLEITCGEAPYITSRYDAVTGVEIPVKDRIGMLDRKLRIVSENCDTISEWLEWGIKAVKGVYGFEWQGDNLFLARCNVFLDFLEHYSEKFNKELTDEKVLTQIAEIISWNFWQMDGLKFVVPMSCKKEENEIQGLSFDVSDSLQSSETKFFKCSGCANDNIFKHNGMYCKIKDWNEEKTLKAVDLLKYKIRGYNG